MVGFTVYWGDGARHATTSRKYAEISELSAYEYIQEFLMQDYPSDSSTPEQVMEDIVALYRLYFANVSRPEASVNPENKL